MLCNPVSQPPEACKRISGKHTQQKQQQHAQWPRSSAAPSIAADRTQSCSTTHRRLYTTQLGKAVGLLSWPWLSAVLVLSLAAPAHAQPQGTCPVSIDYAVSLGQGGGDNSNVPVFVGSVGITNNANLTVQSWRLAWNFTDGETLEEAADYFPNTSYPIPASLNTSRVEIQSTALTASDAQQAVQNAWFYPSQEQTLQFLGHKAPQGLDPGNPYKVAPVTSLFFNNFKCESRGSGNATNATMGSNVQETQYKAIINGTTPTTSLYLEYTPIDWLNLPLNLPPFTQFLVRLTNIGNTTISIDDIALDYWLNGPAETTASVDQFRLVCSDTTLGCQPLLSRIDTAYPNAQGARFKVTLGFNTSLLNDTQAGVVLIPTDRGSGASPRLAPGLAPAPAPVGPLELTELEVLFSIASTQFLVPINSTLDYSYFDAPRSNMSAISSGNVSYIIPRTAIPNPKVTASLNGTLVWGSEPSLVYVGDTAGAGQAGAALPAGIVCQESADGTQVCGLSATYCCFGDGPLSAVIPNIWPPVVTSQAPKLASSNASVPAPAPVLLPSSTEQSNNSALPALAPSPSNGSLQAVNASGPVTAAGNALSPTPMPAPTPAIQNSSMSPGRNMTVPAAAPAANASLPVEAIAAGTLPNQTSPPNPVLNSAAPAGTLPNATAPAQLPVAIPAPTPAATPANSPLPSADSSQSAEQIAANAALGPLLSPATGQGQLPAQAPSPATAPAPGPALGASPSTGQPLSQQDQASTASAGIGIGAIAGIAVAGVVGVALSASVLAFFLLQRRGRQSVQDKQSPKPGVLLGGEGRPKDSGQDSRGGSPPKVLSGGRILGGSRNQDEDRWQGLNGEPLRGHLLESSSTALSGTGDSNQSWLEMGYAPPIGYGLQHQGSGVSQHGLLTNQGLVNSQQVLGNVYQEPGNGPQGLVSGSQGLVNGPHGLVNSTAKSNVGIRHQRQTDNPFVDERWPFTPMAAEPNNGGHTPYGNGYYEHLPFDNRATSAVGPLARMGSSLSHQGSAGLIRFGSGDQYAQGTLVPPGSLADGFGAGMVRQASSPAPGMPFFLHGMAMPWGNPSLGQQLAPAKTAADSAAAANSLVMHGPHSLLERPGPVVPTGDLQGRLLLHKAMSMPSLQDGCLGGDTDGFDSACLDTPSANSPGHRPTQTWNGRLQNWPSMEALPAALHRQRHLHKPSMRRANSAELPPLRPLPPPITLSSLPSVDMDLNVDYQTEVAPFLGACLGSGGFGSVYAARWRDKDVAVKRLSPSIGQDSEQYKALVREVELSSKFNSNRLVRVYGACLQDKANVCLIMELAQGGNLHQRINDKCKGRLCYMEILQLAHDVAEGLAYLHPSVIHRDLKPSNILLDEEGRAKIADFGISRVKDPSKTCLTVTNNNGTPMYMAPEQFNGTRVDEKVDVYSLGCIMNECMTRRQPWRGVCSNGGFFQIIVKVAIQGERPRMDADCPNGLKRLIQKCWHQDPHQRPSCAEIVKLTDIMMHQDARRAR